MGAMIYECTGCGAQFAEGEVKPVFQCSLTHRQPYRGSGHFIDCPRCGKFEGVKDLRMPRPIPVPDGQGPKLRQVKLPTFDTSTVATQGQTSERRACGHDHHPKDGPCGSLSKIPEGEPRHGLSSTSARVVGMVAAVLSETTIDCNEQRIDRGLECTSCGNREYHSPACRPPRGYRKV